MLGIVWNMTEKPGLRGSVAAAVVGYLVGVALAVWFTHGAPAVELAPTATS